MSIHSHHSACDREQGTKINILNTAQYNQMPSTTATSFDCVVCYDEQQGLPAFNAGGDCMCKPCFDRGIKPQFEEHLKNEFSAPMWGAVIIDIDDVKSHFTPEFIGQYKTKMQEYAILPDRRIYCAGRVNKPCGAFAGSKDEMPAAACVECGTVTCGKCDSRTGEHTNGHECSEKKDDASAFAGLQKGKEYQLCPQCATPSEIMDGCNHMTCGFMACDTEYCFICGNKAREGQGHWDFGKPCPKYNQPGDVNAVFDVARAEEDFDDMFRVAQDAADMEILWTRAETDLTHNRGLNVFGEEPE
ncbi:hypothetical protein CERZMDRAFT_85485 [Cercospora zeae-maydis SCOH1-5]|uniref:RBR-type E3 ubiquitin transferase n=1 Tax=Cercospora zeae-maydis SCOH1-5 TaxID=717836 RepID=A0A6A6FD32_9PEZI|nr:hypothetical protein CERZMDRAFT_85485 [Cercospora zeae-maydis SCOH1-5]